MNKKLISRLLGVALAMGMATSLAAAQDWVDAMRAVRANYHDTDGSKITIGRWGDSITQSGEKFFQSMYDSRFQTTPETADAWNWLFHGLRSDCWKWQWTDGNYDSQCWRHGNCNGVAASTAVQFCGWEANTTYYEYWLRHDNPEISLILFGSNDMALYADGGEANYSPAMYKENLRLMVEACKANGTVPILTTLPPHHDFDSNGASDAHKALALEYYQAVVDLAGEEHVPLIDYRNAVLTRAPGDTWDGKALDTDYALITWDGIHPSWGYWWDANWFKDTNLSFSETALDYNGNTLHSYLALMAAYDVYEKVIVPEPCTFAVLAGGAAWLLRRRRRGGV